MCKFGLHPVWGGGLEFQILRVWKPVSFCRSREERGKPVEAACADKQTEEERRSFLSVDCGLGYRVVSFWRRHSTEACGNLFFGEKLKRRFSYRRQRDGRLSLQHFVTCDVTSLFGDFRDVQSPDKRLKRLTDEQEPGQSNSLLRICALEFTLTRIISVDSGNVTHFQGRSHLVTASGDLEYLVRPT